MDATNLPALSIADLNTTINHEPRVADLRLAEALGYSDQHKIRNLISAHAESLKSFGEVVSATARKLGRGRPGTTFWLNKRQALYITAKSDTPRAAEITVQMVEVFDAYLQGKVPAAEPEPVKKITAADLTTTQLKLINKRANALIADDYRKAWNAMADRLIEAALNELRAGREPVISALMPSAISKQKVLPAPTERACPEGHGIWDGKLIDLRPNWYEKGDKVLAVFNSSDLRIVTNCHNTRHPLGWRSGSIMNAAGQWGDGTPFKIKEGMTIVGRVVEGDAP